MYICKLQFKKKVKHLKAMKGGNGILIQNS